MLDVKFIRENSDLVKKSAVDKRIDCDVDRLLEVDEKRRALQADLDALRTEVKEKGGLVGQMRNPKSPWYKKAVVLSVVFYHIIASLLSS